MWKGPQIKGVLCSMVELGEQVCSVTLHLSICLSDCRETRSNLLLLVPPDWSAVARVTGLGRS